MNLGKKTWVFCDGDLPPAGNSEPFAHEAMMVVNNSDKLANLKITLLFEDKEPKENITLTVEPKRVRCIRMDMPLGEEGFKIPFGQFAVILESDVEVVAVYGRLDRRPDMAYYPVQGYSV